MPFGAIVGPLRRWLGNSVLQAPGRLLGGAGPQRHVAVGLDR
jgi:hypothetical protein